MARKRKRSTKRRPVRKTASTRVTAAKKRSMRHAAAKLAASLKAFRKSI